METINIKKLYSDVDKLFKFNDTTPVPLSRAFLTKYSSYGFILGDSSIIPKRNYYYIEVKSTKVFTVLAGYIYLKRISVNGYLYVNCSKSKHGILDYHIRTKSNGIIVENIYELKRYYDLAKISNILSKMHIPSFIAGFFDADGSVSFNTKKATVKITLISKSYSLLNMISKYLLKYNIHMSSRPTKIPAHLYTNKGTIIKKGTTYQIYTTNTESTRNLLKILSQYSLHLTRRLKIELAINLINKNINGEQAKQILTKIKRIEEQTRTTNYKPYECKKILEQLLMKVNKNGGGAPCCGGGSGGSPAAGPRCWGLAACGFEPPTSGTTPMSGVCLRGGSLL